MEKAERWSVHDVASWDEGFLCWIGIGRCVTTPWLGSERRLGTLSDMAKNRSHQCAQSRLLALLPTIYRGIEKQTSQSSSNKMESFQKMNRGIPAYRHAAFMLNRDLALALPGQLGAYLNNILTMVQTSSA
ncbi:unnamed protein product [Trichobilharzia regenti]|nr:unnamed protein product [Trichobilharzia regenti]